MPTTAAARDRQILKAMADALRATEQFSKVTTSGLHETAANLSADDQKVCALELVNWTVADEDTADSDAGEDMLRTVLFTCWVIVRNEEADARDDEVDRLSCLVANMLGNTGFLGVSGPGSTYFLHGEWGPAMPPERRMRMDGHTQYVVESWQSHDVASDA